MPLQAWGSFFCEVWGLVLLWNPPWNPGRFDGPLGHALSPVAMEDVDAHVGPPSCLGCEAADSSVSPAQGPGAGPLPPAALLFTSVPQHKELVSGGKPAVVVRTLLRPAPPPLALPHERAQATSLGAAESGQKSRLGAAWSLPRCPIASRAERPGGSGERDWHHLSDHRAGPPGKGALWAWSGAGVWPRRPVEEGAGGNLAKWLKLPC